MNMFPHYWMLNLLFLDKRSFSGFWAEDNIVISKWWMTPEFLEFLYRHQNFIRKLVLLKTRLKVKNVTWIGAWPDYNNQDQYHVRHQINNTKWPRSCNPRHSSSLWLLVYHTSHYLGNTNYNINWPNVRTNYLLDISLPWGKKKIQKKCRYFCVVWQCV